MKPNREYRLENFSSRQTEEFDERDFQLGLTFNWRIFPHHLLAFAWRLYVTRACNVPLDCCFVIEWLRNFFGHEIFSSVGPLQPVVVVIQNDGIINQTSKFHKLDFILQNVQIFYKYSPQALKEQACLW